MQTTETMTAETNWAPALTSAVESAGFTITGVPDHLNREQVIELGEGIVSGVLERTPATVEGFAVVAVAAQELGFKLEEIAERCGLRYTDLNDLTSADLGYMSRTIGTMLAERRHA